MTAALEQTFERWDSRGFPNRVGGEALAVSARIVQAVEDAEIYHRVGGVAAAVAIAR